MNHPLLAIPRPRAYKDPQPGREQPLSQVTTTDLARIVAGELDPVDAAAFELQARCRDMRGDYVGPKQSSREYNNWKRGRS